MSLLSDFTGGSGGGIPKRQLFTADGTWTKPANILGDTVWVTMIGGGSSGISYSSANGGNGAPYITRIPVDISAETSVSVTVGQGGAGTTTAQANSGSPSSFGSLLSVPGGVAPNTNNSSVNTLGGAPGAVADSIRRYLPSTTGPFGSVGRESLNGEGYHGGAGLTLDDSGKVAGSVSAGFGGIGYGSGGAGTISGTPGVGADGAVLVEWLEKA